MVIKNVVIVNDWATVDGGAAAVAIQSAIKLAEKYKVYFFSAVGPVDSCLIDCENLVSICLNKPDILHDTNRFRAITKGLWDKDTYRAFEKLLFTLDRKSTVVHFHTWTKALSSSLYSVVAQLDFATVITLHDFFLFCPNGGFFNYNEKKNCTRRPMGLSCLMCNCDSRNYLQKVWRYLRLAIQNCSVWRINNLSFISISNITSSIASPFINDNHKIFHIADPIVLTQIAPNNLSKNDEYVFMGRLSPEKGIELFCEAINNLNLKGTVLGDGPLRDRLQTKYPSINFVGWVSGEEKEQYLSKAKVFVFPSLWYETFGLTVAEAKSYGIPCIVPDKCAASEQIIDNETGFIFETGNLKSLEKVMQKCENSNLNIIQYNIVRTFDKNELSINKHVAQLEDAYNLMLSSVG